VYVFLTNLSIMSPILLSRLPRLRNLGRGRKNLKEEIAQM